MMSREKWLLSLLGSLTIAALVTAAEPGAQNKVQSSPQSKNTNASVHEDEGEKKFQQYCSRCHNAPESLSPRITGTVIRHMRVRANLPKKDAEAILHYLNP
jgi:cytochrome c5